jgi:hypothetical protein
MNGEIRSVGPSENAGQLAAAVQLEGVDSVITVPYWPELLEQWGPAALHAWILQQAVEQLPAAGPALHEAHHAALVGPGEAAPVCRKGEIGCTDEHADEPAVGESSRG